MYVNCVKFNTNFSNCIYVQVKYDEKSSSIQINRKNNFVINYLDNGSNKMVQNFFLFMLAINIMAEITIWLLS